MGATVLTWFCVFYVAISLVFCLHGVDGRHLTIEESLDNNTSNVSHPKIIKTEYGDIYDCVEIYKQPAFQHPLLKHHKIKAFPKQNEVSESSRYGLKKGCPLGTVPIRRTTKEEQLVNKDIFTQQFQPSANLQNNQQNRFAGVVAGPINNQRFGEASAYISTHNPQVGKGQLSGSVISAECDIGGFETVRVGWMVYPDLYKGDKRTRLFTAWGVNNIYEGTQHGCFNTYCPGFVQISPNIPPDFVIDQISVPGGEYSYIKIIIVFQADRWMLIHTEKNILIGYWPIQLFNCLKSGAKVLSWGGWVSSVTQTLPMMGSGLLGNLSSVFRQVYSGHSSFHDLVATSSMVNDTGILRNTDLHISQNNCYRAGINPYKGGYWGDSFWYGGNGGDVRKCPV